MQDTNIGKIDAIYAILKTIGHTERELKSLKETFTPSQILEHVNTVGIHIPRQSGATRWIEHQLFNNPKSIAFTSPRYVDIIKVRSDCYHRVFGFNIEKFPTPDELPDNVDQVFIDDANYTIKSHAERKAFYDWMASTDRFSKDVSIILLNT